MSAYDNELLPTFVFDFIYKKIEFFPLLGGYPTVNLINLNFKNIQYNLDVSLSSRYQCALSFSLKVG